MKTEKRLTKSQALSEGYTHYGYEDEGYQALHDLHDYSEFEPEYKTSLLAERDDISPSTSEVDLKSMVANYLADQWCDETFDDTNEVRDIILKLDFSDIAGKLNQALETKKYYKLSNILLVPNGNS